MSGLSLVSVIITASGLTYCNMSWKAAAFPKILVSRARSRPKQNFDLVLFDVLTDTAYNVHDVLQQKFGVSYQNFVLPKAEFPWQEWPKMLRWPVEVMVFELFFVSSEYDFLSFLYWLLWETFYGVRCTNCKWLSWGTWWCEETIDHYKRNLSRPKKL